MQMRVLVCAGIGLLLLLSGCIISTSPKDDTFSLKVGNPQTFLVTAIKSPYPSNSTLVYQWFVDEEWRVNNASFIYLPLLGDLGTHHIKCRVLILDDDTGLPLSSQSHTWTVTVEL